MALLLLVACVLILALPRQKAIVPFLLAFFFIPASQVVVLGGVHFSALRILVLVALARRLGFSHREKYPGGFSPVDKMVALWTVSALIAFLLQFPTTDALIQGLGTLVDSCGGYLVARFLIPDGQTMRRTIKVLAVVCVIQGVPMMSELFTHTNIYGYFTGVPTWSTVRNGSVRASGTMGALTAGPFGGAFFPVFLWLWKDRKSRMMAWVGIAGSVAMVIASNSSTSQMALGGSLLGLAFWRLRKKMSMVRRVFACTLVALHLYMKAPVWALIGRIDLTGSSSSYQRYIMVDMTIKHFKDWWLIGTPDYINWGWDSYDLCNQFVAVGLTGGLLTLIFYVTIFVRSFRAIGVARKAVEPDRAKEWFMWCFGSTLFAVQVAHWGINYVGVLLMSLFVLLAMIAVVTTEATRSVVRSAEKQDQGKLEFAGSAA
jgi:hypothetical protein